MKENTAQFCLGEIYIRQYKARFKNAAQKGCACIEELYKGISLYMHFPACTLRICPSLFIGVQTTCFENAAVQLEDMKENYCYKYYCPGNENIWKDIPVRGCRVNYLGDG
jgi:hypothetical protein